MHIRSFFFVMTIRKLNFEISENWKDMLLIFKLFVISATINNNSIEQRHSNGKDKSIISSFCINYITNALKS